MIRTDKKSERLWRQHFWKRFYRYELLDGSIRPPDTYDPSFGSALEFHEAHVAYWSSHEHAFEPCMQHTRCRKCSLLKFTVIHQPTGTTKRADAS